MRLGIDPQLFSTPAITKKQRDMFLDRFINDYAYRVMLRPSNLRLEYSRLAAEYYQDKMPVIHLDFTNIHGEAYEDVKRSCVNYMSEVYMKFLPQVERYLNETEAGNWYKKRYHAVINNIDNDIPPTWLLKQLMLILHKATKSDIIVIIDNIDLPILRVQSEDKEKTDTFFENFYTAALKDSSHLGNTLLTGVLPVRVPNNLLIETAHDRYFKGCFPDDADTVPSRFIISPEYEDEINYFLKKIGKSGKNTELRESMLGLLAGGSVTVYSSELKSKFNYHDYDHRPDDLWRTLFFLGLLRVNSNSIKRDNAYTEELVISNQSARNYIQANLEKWLTVSTHELKSIVSNRIS